MADNSNLHMSRAGKTDEFYTQLSLFGEDKALGTKGKKPYKIEITEVGDEDGN